MFARKQLDKIDLTSFTLARKHKPIEFEVKKNEKKKDILKILSENIGFLTVHYGIEKIGLFGSYVRNEFEVDSDLDIGVKFGRKLNLVERLELWRFLRQNIHSKVEITDMDRLHPYLKKEIESEVEYV